MKTKKIGLTLLSFLASLGLVFGIASPAQAASIVTVTLGSYTSVTGYTTYDEYGRTYTLSVQGNFSAKTSTSARLDSVRICSGSLSGSGKTSVVVTPELYIPYTGTTVNNLGYKIIPSTGCATWTVGRTVTKASTGELVRVIAKASLATNHYQTVSFKR